MPFEELDPADGQVRGGGWRPAPAGATADCYIASVWHTLTVVDINDETHELRVAHRAPAGDDLRILSRSEYRSLSLP